MMNGESCSTPTKASNKLEGFVPAEKGCSAGVLLPASGMSAYWSMESLEVSKNQYVVGDSDTRPWGWWKVLATGDAFVVKEISVKPGQILSLQSHRYRSEHWVILSGVAEVTLDDDILERQVDETVFIPVGAKHRIANPGETDMRFIEVQTGPVLSEDDIERYEDRYGRA
jgi:mannose-6-phosphate isomerase-like protein (cupin superfamily)